MEKTYKTFSIIGIGNRFFLWSVAVYLPNVTPENTLNVVAQNHSGV